MERWQFDEYDFRFEGLDSVDRLEKLRSILLKIAGGFTEIQPDLLSEFIPGKGYSYIVGLKTAEQAVELLRELKILAHEWNVPIPQLSLASKGPRTKCCFFLLPLKANPDENGFRRDLFTAQRSINIRNVLVSNGATRIIVFGQWINESGETVEDSSNLYLMSGDTVRIEQFLRTFIEQQIFDNGIECDQAVIYLSSEGKGYWMSETM